MGYLDLKTKASTPPVDSTITAFMVCGIIELLASIIVVMSVTERLRLAFSSQWQMQGCSSRSSAGSTIFSEAKSTAIDHKQATSWGGGVPTVANK